MAYASVSERVKLGSGVLPIFSRTPVATAQAAATIDEFSGGRMVLGIGVSHQVTVENWFDSKIEKPVTQMREYAGIVRALLRREPAPDGGYFNTNFRLHGLRAARRPTDLHRRPVSEHAAAGGRGRRRRGALALRADLYPRHSHPRRRRRAPAGGARARGI